MLRFLTPARLALVLAVMSFAGQCSVVGDYGVTSDAPSLYWAGQRTVSYFADPKEGLDFRNRADDFETVWDRRQANPLDPQVFPVLTGVVAALMSELLHETLGWMDHVDAHHLGLVLVHCMGLFIFCFYACTLFGRSVGVSAAIMLALLPDAIGHSFNNPKDWPTALFYGCSLLACGTGVLQRRFGHVLLAGLLSGISVSCKFNGHLAVVSMFIWVLMLWALVWRTRYGPLGRNTGMALLAIPWVHLGVFVVLWPWLWWTGDAAELWTNFYEHVQFFLGRAEGQRRVWTDYPLRILLFKTPVLLLVLGILGAVVGWRGDRQAKGRQLLLVVWFVIPLFRVALPRANFYDANRHFLEYELPLCIFAGIGLVSLLRWLASGLKRRTPRIRRAVFAVAIVTWLALLAVPLVRYHPFEVTYFNPLIGGLGGAQAQALLYVPPPHQRWVRGGEGDTLWTSARHGMAWLHDHEVTGTVGICHSGRLLWEANWTYEDPMWPILEERDGPRFLNADYLYMMPKGDMCTWELVRKQERLRPILHREERDGGLIYEILGPNDGRMREPTTPINAHMGLP